MKTPYTTVTAQRRRWQWLSRSLKPEPSPIVLSHRRIYVLPSSAGYAFTAALLVMLVASINYNLTLGYGLVFLLASVGIVSIVHAFRNLLGLTIRPGRIEPVFAGEVARFRLLIHNARRSRRASLQVKRAAVATSTSLEAEQTAELVLNCPTHKRGWLPLGRVVLDTVWPLGLIRAWSVLVPDTRCLVYPAPEPNPPPLPHCAVAAQGRQLAARGDDDFAALRTHQPADSPRHVAWKVVARGGPMLTKAFSGADGGELLLDWYALPRQLDVETRIARLTAWVLAAQAHGQPFALSLPDGRSPIGCGPQHLHDCLKRLALHDVDSNDPR